jgi:5-formyltetrahydrofolate cyclo-ligase
VPARGDATDTATAKAQWRQRVRAARRALPPQRRSADAARLTTAILRLAATVPGPLCAHLPVETEPWSADGVEAVRAAGHEVLLPVVARRGEPLDWARYVGPRALAPGPFGLREPVGPRLGPSAVARAGLVLLPALAVDRQGVRLGQGGGFYDRTLAEAGADVLLAAVLGDGELVDELPVAPHDRRVALAILPSSGVTVLPAVE